MCSPAGSSTGIGMGILKQLAAGGATTVMHGLEAEAALRQKADAVAAQYGTTVGTATANLLHPQEIRCESGLRPLVNDAEDVD
jgi:NAD(P)-dependent dehydrogenase (short-subunit alcohol dehydrogenase family)